MWVALIVVYSALQLRGCSTVGSTCQGVVGEVPTSYELVGSFNLKGVSNEMVQAVLIMWKL